MSTKQKSLGQIAYEADTPMRKGIPHLLWADLDTSMQFQYERMAAAVEHEVRQRTKEALARLLTFIETGDAK